MQRDMRAILDGALGGVVGTAGMSAFMLAAGKAGLMGEHPPDTIAGAALDAVGIRQQDEEAQNALAILLHFGFGISCGMLFGVLHRRLPLRLPAALHGMIFAAIIWVTSYQGWIPGPPTHHASRSPHLRCDPRRCGRTAPRRATRVRSESFSVSRIITAPP
jgi:hypothetical protein